MKLNTLLAAAVAAAFSGAVLAQGAGGTTTAPSANQPQGNTPYTAPAGSQKAPSDVPSARGKDTTSGSTSATVGSSAAPRSAADCDSLTGKAKSDCMRDVRSTKPSAVEGTSTPKTDSSVSGSTAAPATTGAAGTTAGGTGASSGSTAATPANSSTSGVGARGMGGSGKNEPNGATK